MKFDEHGKVKPYQTKLERIHELETALENIEKSQSLEEAQNIAKAHRREDGRWKGQSQRSYAALKAAEDAGL